MAVPFDREISVHYGFVHLMPVEASPDLGRSRSGQVNGLLGAAEGTALSMVTGRHTGAVPFRLELLDAEPALWDGWEDVVEASFTVPETAEMLLAAFEESAAIDLPVHVSYRARYCALGIDVGRAADDPGQPTEGRERYLLQLWPAPPAKDAILRETTQFARYWHQQARATPALPPPPTAAERAAAEAAADAERRRERERFHQLMEMQPVVGGAAAQALDAIGGRAPTVARADADVAAQIAGLPPHRQRLLAAFTARWACRFAGIEETEPVAAVLYALEREQPLPFPFHDEPEALRRLFAEGRRPSVVDPRAAALDCIVSATDPDPAAAAIESVADALGVQSDPTRLLTDLRGVLEFSRERTTRARRPSG